MDEYSVQDFLYHSYIAIGGTLTQEQFETAWKSFPNISGFEIRFANSFEELGDPTVDKLGKLYIIPATSTVLPDLFEEYIVVHSLSTTEDVYMWEKWGSGQITVDLKDYYTKSEMDQQIQKLEDKIEEVSSTIWNDVNNSVVKFYRGPQASYNSTTHADGIYFATDTKKIIMNGTEYGGDSNKKVSNVALNANANGIVITYTDSTSTTLLLGKATVTADGLMSKEDKAKLDSLKTLVDELKASVAAALDYKGTKDTYEELPTEGNKKGDVWNVVGAHGTTPAGTNYAWDGTQWDPLGGTIDLSGYYTKHK